ncbi:hypothetical protein [Microvirga sp. P5_D2]
MTSVEKGRALFRASRILEDTWKEVESLAELFERHVARFAKENRPYVFTKAGEGSPDFPEWGLWHYQYDYEFRRKNKKKPDLYLALDIRVCWDDAYKITTTSGKSFEEPVIFIKGSSVDEWDYLEPNISLDEDEDYMSHGKFLWYKEKADIYWLYAVPLFSITSEDDLDNEIVRPLTSILKVASATPEQLQTVFADTRHVLSWQNGENGIAHIVD